MAVALPVVNVEALRRIRRAGAVPAPRRGGAARDPSTRRVGRSGCVRRTGRGPGARGGAGQRSREGRSATSAGVPPRPDPAGVPRPPLRGRLGFRRAQPRLQEC